MKNVTSIACSVASSAGSTGLSAWEQCRGETRSSSTAAAEGDKEWDIRISEYALRILPRHLWLPDSDGDTHTCLSVNLRYNDPRSTVRNQRKRSAAAKAARADKWSRVQWDARMKKEDRKSSHSGSSWSSRQS